MKPLLRTLALAVVCFAAPSQSPAQSAEEGAWWSYREAYRALVRFDKLGTPKHLIQQRVQVQPRAPGTATEGLRLSLQGARTALELPLDAALHAQVPLLKSAFDDNAALRLNRPATAFAFRVRVAISPRPDGLYALSELRAACAQVLALQQQIEPARYEGKRCVGVSLAFARGTNPGLSLQPAEPSVSLAATPGPLYPGESDREHAVVPLRWERLAEGSQLRVAALPLVVAALIE